MLYKLGDVLAKEREWWFGSDNVSLFQKLDAITAPEVATRILRVTSQGDSGGLVALEKNLNVIG